MIDPSYRHKIDDATTAKEAWELLCPQKSFAQQKKILNKH